MDGALNSKTKELLGLVASMVLRCDDCIAYHLQQCYKHGATTNELLEVFGIANLVGGSIVRLITCFVAWLPSGNQTDCQGACSDN